MNAKLYSKETYIGDAELQIRDKSMGVLGGDFIPNSNYNQIRKIICDYNDPSVDSSNSEYYSLTLNCQLSNEIFLLPQGGILIQDLNELELSELEVSVAGVSYEFIELFFEQRYSKNIFLEPWESIAVEQKLEFEEELRKELGSFEQWKMRNLFKPKTQKHKLYNTEFSALCKRGDSDDVLFEIHDKEINDHFAVVHLNWSGKKEQYVTWPICRFFNNFKEFSAQMKIDTERY